MAPPKIPVLLTQKPSTKNGINRATTLLLAWEDVRVSMLKMRLQPGKLFPFGTTILSKITVPYNSSFIRMYHAVSVY